MQEIDLEYPTDVMGIEQIDRLVGDVVESLSRFQVERSTTGEDIRYSASMNEVSIYEVGEMVNVTGRAQDNIAERIEEVLRQKTGTTGDMSDNTRQDPMDEREMSGSRPDMEDVRTTQRGDEPQAHIHVYEDGKIEIEHSDGSMNTHMTSTGVFFDEQGNVVESYVQEGNDGTYSDMMIQSMVDSLRQIMRR
jgi:hypothetical protein